MNFGGIIAGALGGGAQAVQGMAQEYIKEEAHADRQKADHQNRIDLTRIEQENALAKQKAIEDHKQRLGDESRAKRAADINERTTGIIRRGQAQKLSNFYNKDPDAVPTELAPEDISDEELAMVPPTDRETADARTRAAAEAGYLDPAHEATANSRTAALEARQDTLEKTLRVRQTEGAANRESRETIATNRDATRESIAAAKLDAELAKDGGKGSNKDRLTTIVNSMNATIRSLTESDRPRTPEGKAAWQQQMDDAVELRKQATERLRGITRGDSAPAGSGKVGTPHSTSGSSSSKKVADALKLWKQ